MRFDRISFIGKSEFQDLNAFIGGLFQRRFLRQRQRPYSQDSLCLFGGRRPEAFDGGPIALVKDGDTIVIDIAERRIDLVVAAATLAERKSKWFAPAPAFRSGVMAKYIKLVGSASQGAVTSQVF